MSAETSNRPSANEMAAGTQPSPAPSPRSAATTLSPPEHDSLGLGHIELSEQEPARRGPNRWTAAGRLISAEAPRLRQLMGVCGWAAVLGGVGLIIGIRGFIGVLGNDTPGWYEPSMAVAGLAGIALTVGAFLTVNRRVEPWIMLGLSSMALMVSMLLTSAAL